MTANKPTTSGELDISALKPDSRSSYEERSKLERDALQRPDGRHRRRKGRTETLSLKTKPETIATIHRISTVEDITMTEVVERAIALYDKALKGA